MRYDALAKIVNLKTGVPYMLSCTTTSDFGHLKEQAAKFYEMNEEDLLVREIRPVDDNHPMAKTPRREQIILTKQEWDAFDTQTRSNLLKNGATVSDWE